MKKWKPIIFAFVVTLGIGAVVYDSLRNRPLIRSGDSAEAIIDKSIRAAAGDNPHRFDRGRIWFEIEFRLPFVPPDVQSIEEGFIEPDFRYRKWRMAPNPKIGDQELDIVNGDQRYVKLFGGPSQTTTIGLDENDSVYRCALLAVLDWLWLKEAKPRLETKGTTREADREMVIVQATYENGDKIELHIDVRTGLVFRIKGLSDLRRFGTRKTEDLLEDYVDVRGGKLPTKLTRIVEGKVVGIIRITRFDFDTPIDESEFAIPEQ